MPIPPLDNGVLPHGRWSVSREELYAFAQGLGDVDRRSKLLTDWDELTNALREVVGSVAACWLSGSFFTSKDWPNDLDVVYWVHRDQIVQSRGDADKALFLQLVADSQVKSLGLELDSYLLAWWPRPGSHRGSAERKRDYLESRGYWDDLWCRVRDPDLKRDKLIRRGYVEVIIDGYS
ncbi:hypothetical protein HJ590_15200 [Naumannella sp. ID2617S]|nr:hypothetical protein [Naumannella sp. ID2617S]